MFSSFFSTCRPDYTSFAANFRDSSTVNAVLGVYCNLLSLYMDNKNSPNELFRDFKSLKQCRDGEKQQESLTAPHTLASHRNYNEEFKLDLRIMSDEEKIIHQKIRAEIYENSRIHIKTHAHPSLPSTGIHWHFAQEKEITEKNFKCLINQLNIPTESKKSLIENFDAHLKKEKKQFKEAEKKYQNSVNQFSTSVYNAFFSTFLQMYIKPFCIEKKIPIVVVEGVDLLNKLMTHIYISGAGCLDIAMTHALNKIIAWTTQQFNFLPKHIAISFSETLSALALGSRLVEKDFLPNIHALSSSGAVIGNTLAMFLINRLPKLRQEEPPIAETKIEAPRRRPELTSTPPSSLRNRRLQ